MRFGPHRDDEPLCVFDSTALLLDGPHGGGGGGSGVAAALCRRYNVPEVPGLGLRQSPFDRSAHRTESALPAQKHPSAHP